MYAIMMILEMITSFVRNELMEEYQMKIKMNV